MAHGDAPWHTETTVGRIHCKTRLGGVLKSYERITA
jgi:hypothetical protein